MRYDRGVADATGIRPIILEFAKQMEAKLAKNDHKDHWREAGLQSIFAHFRAEVDELKEALMEGHSTEEVVSEACDVALMAMMCADIIKSMGEET